MTARAWSHVAVSAIARATVEGVNVKRPAGMPRRRWQRVRHGRRWSKAVRSEVRSLVSARCYADERAERRRLGLEWWA